MDFYDTWHNCYLHIIVKLSYVPFIAKFIPNSAFTLFYQLNTLCHVTGCEINLIAAKKYFSKTITLLLKFFIVFSVAFFAKDVTIKRSCPTWLPQRSIFQILLSSEFFSSFAKGDTNKRSCHQLDCGAKISFPILLYFEFDQ